MSGLESPTEISNSTETDGYANKLSGLTKGERAEIHMLREMTIKQAGTRGTLRFIELWVKIGDALYKGWSRA